MSLLNFFTTLKQGFGYVNIRPWIACILRSLRFFVNLMSELQRFIVVAITTSWYAVRQIYYKMSRQCWTNVVILTWWHQSRYNVMYWICDVAALPQRCDTFALLLGIKQWKIFSHFYFWKWILKNGKGEASPLNSKYWN